jgi:hypothetical protein
MNPKVRVSQDARTTKQNKGSNPLDEKQKKKIIDAILADNPHLAKDTLHNYYLERLVESYLIDPDNFNRSTTDAIKHDKKTKKEGDVEVSMMPKEVVCISKVEAEGISS